MQSNRQHMIMEPPLYQKLHEEDSIRLLILEPGNRNSPISCRLEEVRLSAKPIYKAVSYTWGEPVLSDSICINGRPMRVRYNLFTALLYLRHTSHTQTLWIDALTINQNDISERNQQVRIIGQIYKGAFLTIVWLREENESDIHALKIIKLCNVLAKDNSITTEAKYHRISDSIFKDDPSNTENILTSLRAIFTSRWLGRLWIVQEFALSPHVIMCCGDKVFLPRGLTLLHLVWRQLRPRVQTSNCYLFTEAITKVNSLLHMRNTAQERSALNLGDLLLLTVGICEATEPLDSVFALLSLIKPGDSTLQPDYNLTAAQVFSAAARITWESGISFSMLWLSCRNFESALKRSLPSWVPDFSDPDMTHGRLSKRPAIYSAGGNKPPTCSFDESGLVLKLKAKILDKISILQSSPPGQGASWNLLQEWYNECKRLAHENGDYPSTEQFSNCWWRLAICDVHVSDRTEYSRASSGFGSFYLDQTIIGLLSSDNAGEDFVHLRDPIQRKHTEYLHSLLRHSADMAFCRTGKRYLGWAPPHAQTDDKLCLFVGD
jgi:hypothetical protein